MVPGLEWVLRKYLADGLPAPATHRAFGTAHLRTGPASRAGPTLRRAPASFNVLPSLS